ncbi:MAG: sugar transferase [Actinobacteria bacterium]|nr:sugar transferase [Actinomycetota bacterium]
MAGRKLALSIGLDIGSLLVALVVASIVVFGTVLPWHFRQDVGPLVGSLLFGAVVGCYVAYRSAGKEVPRPSYGRAFSVFMVAVTVSAFTLVFSRAYFSRSYLGWAAGVWLALELAHRAVRRRRPWTEPLVVVTGEKELVDHLLTAPHAQIVEVLDPAGPVPERPLPKGTTLAVDLRSVLSDEMARFVSSSNLAGYPLRSLASAYEEHTGRLAIVHLHEGWELTVPLEGRGPYVRTKRLFDTLAVLLAAPVALVLGGLIAVAIRLDSRGPVVFKQRRIGLEGRPFTLYKFRTMRTNNEGEREARFASRSDDRLTRVGRFLRLIRVDELPQLWNVLRGDLSLVGPRPEQGPFVERFSETIPFYTHRHLVRPGLTGWAQVNFGYADGHADTIEKLSYDLYYVKHVGVWLDLEVLGRSVWTVMSGFGAR